MMDPYVYEGTGILINKAGLKDQKKLDDFESTMVQLAMIKLLKDDEVYSSVTDIFAIHEILFQEVYSWAGQKRTVNIIKNEPILDGMSVAYSDHSNIESDLEKIQAVIENTDWKSLTQNEKLAKTAEIISDIWKVHAFREGNTRAVSVFLHYFMKKVGLTLNDTFISTHAKYFRNALVMASLGEYRENQYLENILNGAIADKSSKESSTEYRTIKGYNVDNYEHNYHRTE